MRRKLFIFISILSLIVLVIPNFVVHAAESQTAAVSKKREMRATWIATTYNIDWPSGEGLSASAQKSEFINLLDQAKSMGMNAVVVQVRPSADAFYPSQYNPWSEYLTGTQGKSPGYDPLAFMVEEAHKRNLEFHAWFNPYRISTGSTDLSRLAPNNQARLHPDWVVSGKGMWFNPGLPAVQDYIVKSIMEVVHNYDIDAVHLDDYFYPYASFGEFQDDATFQTYGNGLSKADWRRNNVNTLVKKLSQSIKNEKPYVKFGISPFGIWRNIGTDASGSKTNGLQSYDDIYADTRTWIQNKWLDYVTPQIYWPFNYPAAPYQALVDWWSKEVTGKQVQLYIGQGDYNINTTTHSFSGTYPWQNANELPNQLRLNRTYAQVQGSMHFSISDLKTNPLGITDALTTDIYKYPALIPAMPWIDNTPPARPSSLSVEKTSQGSKITWNKSTSQDATYYVIYRFPAGASQDINNSSNIVTTVRDNKSQMQSYVYANATGNETYAVTAVDRLHNESTPTLSAPAVYQGWIMENNTWYYYTNGQKETGWILDNNAWYFLDNSGAMKTGWILYNNTWYFLDNSGAMKTGWILYNNTWYFLDNSGAMKTGWISYSNTWYFLDGSGAMKTGWILYNNTWYFLDGSGAMKTGWILYNNTWYFLDGSGAMKTGWILYNNTWYFLDGSGAWKG